MTKAGSSHLLCKSESMFALAFSPQPSWLLEEELVSVYSQKVQVPALQEVTLSYVSDVSSLILPTGPLLF